MINRAIICKSTHSTEQTPDRMLSCSLPGQFLVALYQDNSPYVLGVLPGNESFHEFQIQNNLFGLPNTHIHISPDFTLCPDEWKDSAGMQDLIATCFRNTKVDALKHNFIPTLNSYVFWKPVADLSGNIPSQMHILELMVRWGSGKIQNGLLTYFGNGFFICCGFKQNQLVLANSYRFQNEKDALYFLLLAFQVSGLDVETHPCVITGECSPEGKLGVYIDHFIQEIEYPYFKEFSELSMQYYLPTHTFAAFHFLNS